jgi:hypothetical protein
MGLQQRQGQVPPVTIVVSVVADSKKNLACNLSEDLGFYVFIVTYPDSIVEKSHLPSMMADNPELGIKDGWIVFDRGF